MKQMFYRLDKDHNPIPCTIEEIDFSEGARRVAKTQDDDIMVSTVFLALDHNWDSDGQPILFETMVFGGPLDQYQWRYHTWDEALQGHSRAVELVTEAVLEERK